MKPCGGQNKTTPQQERNTSLPGGIKVLWDLCNCAHYLEFLFWSKMFAKLSWKLKVNSTFWKALLKWIWTWKCCGFKSSVEFFDPLACVVWLLTDEGGWGQFDLIHAVDRAVGAHGATYCQAVEHFARLDQCFASHTARKFTVCLGQREKTSHQNNWIYMCCDDNKIIFSQWSLIKVERAPNKLFKIASKELPITILSHEAFQSTNNDKTSKHCVLKPVVSVSYYHSD